MPRYTEMEIRVGESFDPNANERIRVVKSKDHPGNFTLIEADSEALKAAKANGQAFEWIESTQTDDLTAKQIGDFVTSKLRESKGKK